MSSSGKEEGEVIGINSSCFTARPRSSASSSGFLVVYRVLNADERAEDEASGRMRRIGSWGEQEEQRKEEKEGRRGRRRARWARWVVELVTMVMSAWEGERRRLEARESRWEEDCIQNIFTFSKVPILPF